jgi:hypothetical protein
VVSGSQRHGSATSGAGGDDDLCWTKQLLSKPPAPSNLARDGSRLDIVGGYRRDSLVLVRIEGLSFGLDWLYPEFAESIEEQAVRGGDALVEWRVRGARRERAFERVEWGQDRQQRVTTALVTRPFVLPRRPAPKVLEVREQPDVPVLLFIDGAPALFDLVADETIAATLGLHGSALP